MTVEGWIAVAATIYVFMTLMLTRHSADVVFVSALTLLILPVIPPNGEKGWHGVLKVEEALSGLANSGTITVAILFVVVAGLKETGGVSAVAHWLLGRPKSIRNAQARLMVPSAAISAFINNTPLVAIMIPTVMDWAEKLRFSTSKLMIPLSYATILGGICSLIGTSTNLTVHGLMQKQTPELYPLPMFEITWVGLPCAVLGILYLYLAAPRLLPDRRPALASLEDPREYTIEMMVETNGPLVGRTIEQAGLRHLAGVYLMEIERGEAILQAVGPEVRLAANDRLIFVGVVDSVKDLKRIRGLAPATDQVFKIGAGRTDRCLVEAVVSNTCPLAGQSIREGRFRTIYDAAVVAVGRNGERIKAKIGDIVLRAGDTLLLETHPSFIDRMKDSRDFFLVHQVADSSPVRHERAWISILILVAMVIAMSTQFVEVVVAAAIAAGLMIVTRCCTTSTARASVDWQLIIVIASSLGLAEALHQSGADQAIAQTILNLAGSEPWAILAAIYVMTVLFSELLANNAAAALVFPIAVASADKLDVNPMPFIMAVMIAASCSFATPIGYQTNMMVYGPGGYRFFDYTRIGLPLNFVVGITTIALIPFVWPFH